MYHPSLQAQLVQARVQDLHRSRETFAWSRVSADASIALRRPKSSLLSTFVRRHAAGRGRLRVRNA